MPKIRECGEKLVDLRKYCPKVIISDDIKNQAYLRKTVADKINKALEYLPKGMTFHINSTWRSVSKQKQLYHQFENFIKSKHPGWNKEKLKKYVEKFVAPFEGKYISGHMTGAAFDIRLIKNGQKIAMRTNKLNYEENSRSYQPKLPKHLQNNREIMFKALKSVGFRNCPDEYWHWSYGDIWWAKYNNKKIATYDKVDVKKGKL